MLEWVPLDAWRTLPAVSGIYVIRHRTSSKEYVGLSDNVRRRAGKHINNSRKSSLVFRAIAKYGAADFDVAILHTAPPERLPTLEMREVAARGTLAPGGYNLTAGGEGTWGRRHTDQAKEKMRQARLGKSLSAETRAKIATASQAMTTETKLKISAAGRGQVRSAETRARMSEANRNRPLEHWERIAEKTRNREVTAETRQKQSEQARNRSQTHRANIAAANTGKRAGAATKSAMRAAKVRPVWAWPPDALIPLEFESCDAAARWAGKTGASLSNYCRGKTKSPCGTVYAYVQK